MAKLIRFWVTSNGKPRGGWIVASVGVDKDGKEYAGPMREGIATKKEAKRIAANLNQELQNSRYSENEIDVTVTVNVNEA
jgi:hypothetical protein